MLACASRLSATVALCSCVASVVQPSSRASILAQATRSHVTLSSLHVGGLGSIIVADTKPASMSRRRRWTASRPTSWDGTATDVPDLFSQLEVSLALRKKADTSQAATALGRPSTHVDYQGSAIDGKQMSNFINFQPHIISPVQFCAHGQRIAAHHAHGTCKRAVL